MKMFAIVSVLFASIVSGFVGSVASDQPPKPQVQQAGAEVLPPPAGSPIQVGVEVLPPPAGSPTRG